MMSSWVVLLKSSALLLKENSGGGEADVAAGLQPKPLPSSG